MELSCEGACSYLNIQERHFGRERIKGVFSSAEKWGASAEQFVFCHSTLGGALAVRFLVCPRPQGRGKKAMCEVEARRGRKILCKIRFIEHSLDVPKHSVAALHNLLI